MPFAVRGVCPESLAGVGHSGRVLATGNLDTSGQCREWPLVSGTSDVTEKRVVYVWHLALRARGDARALALAGTVIYHGNRSKGLVQGPALCGLVEYLVSPRRPTLRHR